MKHAFAITLFLLSLHALLASDAQSRSFDGEISDSQCGFNVHSLHRSHAEMLKTGSMGKTDGECAERCVRQMGGQFVFVSSAKGSAYKVEPQDEVKGYAGRKVRIWGTLIDGHIQVNSIKAL